MIHEEGGHTIKALLTTDLLRRWQTDDIEIVAGTPYGARSSSSSKF